MPDDTVDGSPSGLLQDHEYLDFLKVEAEHFYQAELHAEQRASWMLTTAVGALALILNAFVAITEKKINARIAPALGIAASFVGASLVMALCALWPLRGSRGVPFGLFRRPQRGAKPASASVLDLWRRHYDAHRLRAELRSVLVVRTMVLLSIGIACSAFAVFQNIGIL